MEKTTDLELIIKSDSKLKTNIKNLELPKLYNNHLDLVQEIIKKKHIYNPSYINQLMNDYEGTLFNNREELFNMILSNFVSVDELHKRPFAKLTKDIWDQLNTDSL